jgi:hypothetical protein
VGVRLQRGDWGIVAGALAAVVLIGGFLIATSGSPDEADAGPTTTVAPQQQRGLVRVGSDADPDLEWATARGAFRVECEEGRVSYLDAKVTRLPADLRYGWRVITGDDVEQSQPLTSRPGVSADLLQGDGLPSAFRPTAAGKATVRFTFAEPRRDVIVQLGLTVLDVPSQQSFVVAAPRLTCRGTT